MSAVPGMKVRSPLFSRRSVLACSAALPTAITYRATAATGSGVIPFGAAVQARYILIDAGFRNAVIRNCDSITPELEFKWDFIEGDPGKFYLRPADQLAQFARTFGKQMHGHALVWHKSVPPWATERMLAERQWAIIGNFFAALVPRFVDTVASWDVVNEPVGPGDRDDGLRASPFLTAFGPDYVRRAFDSARALAPRATLYLNEYGLLYNLPDAAAKRAATLRLLERLRNQGAPVDGLGIQAHLQLGLMPAFDQDVFARFLRQVADLGLKIRISELDVAEAETSLQVEQRDERVGRAVADVLDVAADNVALTGVTCWGLSDRYSWLPPESESAGLNRGLPLDSQLRAKPMYLAIKRVLQRL